MPTIKETIAEIGREVSRLDGYDPPELTGDRSRLQPFLDQLNGGLPRDFIEYLDHGIPAEPYGLRVEFHDLESLIIEHEEAEPGADAIQQGFFCIAKEGDGTQFAYDISTRKVLQIECAYETADDTRKESWNEWNSLLEFLTWVLDDLRAEDAH